MSTQNKQEKFHACLHALNSTLFCVFLLKNKNILQIHQICVLTALLCSDHSLGWHCFVSHSYPFLLSVLANTVHSLSQDAGFFLGRRGGTMGLASDWAVVWTNCRNSLGQGKMPLVPAPPPISFVPVALLSLHLPGHWGGEGGFEKSEGGREKDFNVCVWITVWNVLVFYWRFRHFKWVASASGLKTN